MREGSPWTRLKYGVSSDIQRGARMLGPAGPVVLQRLSDAGKWSITRFRTASWHTLPRELKAVLLPIVASLLVSIIIYAPPWLIASWKGQVESKDVAKLESGARTAIIQALGGAAVLLGLYFTAKTWRTTQEGQITDRFTKAINQLGETGPEKLAIRLGGIYALERIARDSERDHWPIMEILTAYVREHSPWKEEEEDSQEEISPSERPLKSTAVPIGGGLLLTRENTTGPELAVDIQAVLTVLGRHTRTYGKGEDQPLNLLRTHLRGAALANAQLQKARLSYVQLQDAYLVGAELQGADLTGAQLQRVEAWGAEFQEANLWDAILKRADLVVAQLQGAMLIGTQLQRADLRGARLQGADLSYAHLQRADLRGAQLQGAQLIEAELQGALLLDTQLERAYLGGAKLSGARGLTIEQLSTVETLYEAVLDAPLREQIEQRYPHLLEEPQLDETESP
jgi:uncharacterized protein YjbI with pentapeptide repeats